MTGLVMVTKGGGCGGGSAKKAKTNTNGISYHEEEQEHQNQLSLVTFVLTAIRKSMVACRVDRGDAASADVMPGGGGSFHQMEIGWPTNVQHVAHVTFDRFNGFLGLPVEFEVEIPGRVPSASASVFGVSAESMQCSFDSKGNSVPTILLLMQERLYNQGGLKAEGIFRINPENSQEEHVRDQLNRGIVPNDIDVHCLAGLIKAWFRELPSGVLDGLSPEEVLKCDTEEESVDLVKLLKPTESALLSWAIELMADVVEEEELNKMNARNIAMVFAPNMTQMSDPLTALMHAVQVMNLLKTLIIKTLREREEAATGEYSSMSPYSYNQPSEEDYDSQQDMETSSESRGPASDQDDEDGEPEQSHYSCSENIDVVALTEIEECFLRHLDGRKSASTRFMDQPSGDLQRDHLSFRSCPGLSLDPIVTSVDSKVGNSRSSTSDEEDSEDGLKSIQQVVNTNVLLDECRVMEDVEMDNRLMQPSPSV